MISYNNMEDEKYELNQTRRGMSRGDFRMEKWRLA